MTVKTFVADYNTNSYIRVDYVDSVIGGKIIYFGNGYLLAGADEEADLANPNFSFEFSRKETDWNELVEVQLSTEYEELKSLFPLVGNLVIHGIQRYEIKHKFQSPSILN